MRGFFGRLKNEFFYHRDWSGVAVESFMELLDEYIRFYNEAPQEAVARLDEPHAVQG